MHGNPTRTGILALLLLVLFTITATAQPLYQVQVPNKAQLPDVMAEGFDIIPGPDSDQLTLYVVGWDGTAARLDALGVDYFTYIDDMVAWNQARLGDELDDMGGYPTYSEYEAWIDTFCTDNSNIVDGPITLGYSLEGRAINAIKISDNPQQDEDEPELLLNSMIHCREVVAGLSLKMLAEDLVASYGDDPRLTEFVDEREIFLIFTMNPDGYVYNEQIAPNGGGMHRKNMRDPDGVDLNRNYDYMWAYDDEGSSPDPYDPTYRGASAGSEPETIVFKDWVNTREFDAVIHVHTYSDIILLPYGFSVSPRPDNWDIYLAFGTKLNEDLDWLMGGPEVLYPANGTTLDWTAAGDPDEPTSADYQMWSFLYEIGSWWEGGFWPDYNTGVQLAEEVQSSYYNFLEYGPNPFVLAPPVPPVMLTSGTVPPEFTLEWSHDDPYGNDAVSFDVAELMDPVYSDDAEIYQIIGWQWDGFQRSGSQSHQGNYSYWSGSENDLNSTMTTDFTYTVEAGDAIEFWTYYDIEEDWDYAYVLASTDGSNFETLAGNITTNDNPNGTNQGNGITGTSGGWIQGSFPLDDYVGEDVYIRVQYLTDGGVSDPGFWFEEITPFLGFEDSEIIASDVTGTELLVDYGDVQDDVTAYFTARAIDVDDQVSAWATPAELIVQGNGIPASLNLTPITNTVPGNGGTVTYSAHLQTFVAQPFTGVTWWTMVTLPNGNEVGPVSQQLVSIPANADITIPMLTLDVPGYAPGGMYTFTGNLGFYPQSVLDDSFEFIKLGNAAAEQQDGTTVADLSSWSASDLPTDVFHDVAGDGVATLPKAFELGRAYPNPFNPTTTVSVALPEAADVTVAVYDVLGQQVAELVSGPMTAGTHALTFDGSRHASGVYFIHADAGALGNQVRKVVLMK